MTNWSSDFIKFTSADGGRPAYVIYEDIRGFYQDGDGETVLELQGGGKKYIKESCVEVANKLESWKVE